MVDLFSIVNGIKKCSRAECIHTSAIMRNNCKHEFPEVCMDDNFKHFTLALNSCTFCGKKPTNKTMDGVGDVMFNSQLEPSVFICGDCAGAVVGRCNQINDELNKLKVTKGEKPQEQIGVSGTWACDKSACGRLKGGVCTLSNTRAKQCRNTGFKYFLEVKPDGKGTKG